MARLDGVTVPRITGEERRYAWIAGAILLVVVWAGIAYNHLVRARAAVDAQWGQVEVQYQRRVDLVPVLVGAVSGALSQERAVFAAIASARAAYMAAPPGSAARVRAADALEPPLARLVAIVEASPTLLSQGTVAGLMDELAGTENRIAVERRRYNERVAAYNTLIQQFPSSVIAGIFGFRPRQYFEAAPKSTAPPAVTLPSP
jgi:LemA protein